MRKTTVAVLLIAGLLAVLTATAAQRSVSGSAQGPIITPIPVLVRVFDGDRFVTDLSLKDFELTESGFAAEPQALFLVRKNAIERREGSADIHPDLVRTIFVLFSMTEYNNKIAEAMDYLFEKELIPGDSLEIQTAMGNYRLSPQSFATKPRNVLARELNDIVRRDILRGSMAYNSLLRELRRAVRQIGGAGRTGLSDTEGDFDDGTSLELQLMNYSEDLQKMEHLRVLNEEDLVRFAAGLKSRPGQKSVYCFYQREFRPEINSNTLSQMLLDNQDRPTVLAELNTLFQMYSRSITLNHLRLKTVFADSGASFNFLYINKQPERISGVTMREQSEDVFSALSTIAAATGGITDSSQNPAASIKTTLNAAEACYILYFTPSVAAPPGTFMDIAVKVRSRNYRVVHRAGYLARS